MPAKARFLTQVGVIEVAPNIRLRAAILDGLDTIGAMTSSEVADLAYWGRHPWKSRLGAQWRASESARSATRRAIAALRLIGQIEVVGHRGRAVLYRRAEGVSAGVPWSEVPEFARRDVEWIDGRHGPAKERLPSEEDVPIPRALQELPVLSEGRPRGATAMLDAAGARHRLADCRPGAWLVSPWTGWRWAKWPDGQVGWIPADVTLPDTLRVSSLDDRR